MKIKTKRLVINTIYETLFLSIIILPWILTSTIIINDLMYIYNINFQLQYGLNMALIYSLILASILRMLCMILTKERAGELETYKRGG